MNTEIMLANTYHLYLRPGTDIIEKNGGLHQFMNWSNSILTDSGGYQVFSLSNMNKITDNGVDFKSHLDGSMHKLTPEKVIKIQSGLDSTISMPLDECPSYPIDKEGAAQSMKLSMRWAKRSRLAYEERSGYGLFGITQGGVHDDLREESASALIDIGFEGYAIGGLAVGEGQDLMFRVTEETVRFLPLEKTRYCMQ